MNKKYTAGYFLWSYDLLSPISFVYSLPMDKRNRLPLDSILSEMDPVHILTPSFSIHFNIILPSIPSFPSESFLSNFPAKYFYPFITLMQATCFANLILDVTKIRGFNGGEIVDCWIMTSCCLVWLPGFRRSLTKGSCTLHFGLNMN